MYSARRILKAIYWLAFGSRAERRRVKQEIVRMFSHCMGGFHVSEDHKIWLTDREFIDTCKRLSPGNYYSQERKYMLREMARYVAGLEGETAECGSYEGASAYLIARELPDVPLHLFDSFEGLPAPSQADKPARDTQLHWQEGALRSPVETIRKNLEQFNNIHIHRGWIPERFTEVADRVFRLLHIDVDLYQPTLDSLEFFYPRMVSGGVIVMDDYGFENCPGANRAAEEFMDNKPEMIIHCPTGQGIIIKQ